MIRLVREGSRGIKRLTRKAKAGVVNPTSVGKKALDMADRTTNPTPPSERLKNFRGLKAAHTSVESDIQRVPKGYNSMSPAQKDKTELKRAHQSVKSARRANSRGIGSFQGSPTDSRSDEPANVTALQRISNANPEVKQKIQQAAHSYRIKRAQRSAMRNPSMN